MPEVDHHHKNDEVDDGCYKRADVDELAVDVESEASGAAASGRVHERSDYLSVKALINVLNASAITRPTAMMMMSP